MASVIHRAPSVGAILNKILEINPDLGTREIGKILLEAVESRGGVDNEFSTVESINEAKALELARRTLIPSAAPESHR